MKKVWAVLLSFVIVMAAGVCAMADSDENMPYVHDPRDNPNDEYYDYYDIE